MMVLAGARGSFEIAFASASIETSPETGSRAPWFQASWWLPRITHWSGHTDPWRIAMTFCAVTVFQLNSSCSRTVAGPGPMR